MSVLLHRNGTGSLSVDGKGEEVRQGLNSMNTKGMAVFAVVVAILSGRPLYDVVRYALKSDLYSHALLVPFISGYLIWLKVRKDGLPSSEATTEIPHSALQIPHSRGAPLAILFGMAGLAFLAIDWILTQHGSPHAWNDRLALAMLSFLSFLVAGGLFFLGPRLMGSLAFPIAFLIFMVPLPSFLINGLEVFLQHSSATAADAFLSVTGTTYFRQGLVFQLPGINIRVAEECSGIRSSLVLFITSLLAGHLFLRSNWKRAVLAFVVIPLGILRNGFRIFTISMLCVHVGPEMINSPIHHRGGPLFFVLSLIPFFLLLWLLRRGADMDRARNQLVPNPTHPDQPVTKVK